MKTLTYTIAIFMAVATSSAYAHHPSEGVSPSYDMVDAQLEAVSSPHLEMDMDAMGATTAAGDSDMATSAQDQAGWTSTQEESGEATRPQPQTGVDVDPPMNAAAAAGTIGLME